MTVLIRLAAKLLKYSRVLTTTQASFDQDLAAAVLRAGLENTPVVFMVCDDAEQALDHVNLRMLCALARGDVPRGLLPSDDQNKILVQLEVEALEDWEARSADADSGDKQDQKKKKKKNDKNKSNAAKPPNDAALKEVVWSFFLRRLRRNFHGVLCCDSAGGAGGASSPTSRRRLFPALFEVAHVQCLHEDYPGPKAGVTVVKSTMGVKFSY